MVIGGFHGSRHPICTGLDNRFRINTSNIAIAVGSIILVFSALEWVDYEKLGEVFRSKRVLGVLLLQKRIIG